MVTQRRVHSVYHQNVDLTQLIRPYLDLSPRSPTLPLDETLQEIVNASFAFPLEESVAWSPQTVQSAEAPQAVQHSSNAHLDAILESVPACGFCRSQHIKCDRSLPACGVCERGNRGCMYFDVVLERDVPRRSVPASSPLTHTDSPAMSMVYISDSRTSTPHELSETPAMSGFR